MHDDITMSGRFVITALDANTGRVVWRKELKNLLTQISQTVRQQQLLGTYTGPLNQLQIQYFAFGTGTTAPAVTDTQLGNEQFRKQVTQISAQGTGNVYSVLSLGAQEANFTITEIGVFCGPTATSSANTGVLLSRVAVNIVKNSNLVLNVARTDICTINGGTT